MSLKVLTANKLIDGHPVWYNRSGGWSKDINDAVIADNPQDYISLEQIGKKCAENNEIVNAMLIDVENREGQLHALRLRERIRADGPTIDYMQNQHF